MILFYRTAHAHTILAEGFRDDRDGDANHSGGVWLSTGLLGCPDGDDGDVVLILKLPMAVIRAYEQVHVGQTYRTFRVPAAVLNHHAGRMVARPWRAGTRSVTPSGAETFTATAETPRQFFARVPDEREAAALIDRLAERVVNAVRDHLHTQPAPLWPRWMTTATLAKYLDRTDRGIRGLIQRGPCHTQNWKAHSILIDSLLIAGCSENGSDRRRSPAHPRTSEIGGVEIDRCKRDTPDRRGARARRRM
jgi:hypothetical protein